MQVSMDNKWLGGVKEVSPFIVDKSKDKYYIQYFKTKRYVSQVNNDWNNIKTLLNRMKVEIRVINSAIDSEDYKAQTKNIIEAIDSSTAAIDDNFSKLFSSVVKRMQESAKSDEWFSSVAKLYSDYILSAILGGKMHNGQASATPSATTTAVAPDTPLAQTLADQPDNALSAQSVQYGPANPNAAVGTSSGSTSSPSAASQGVVGEGREVAIPDSVKQTGICRNYTGYDKFYGKWTEGTMQRELSEQWGAAGKPSSNGIATLDNRYLVAVSPKFGKVGDNIDVVLKDGQVINAKIADMKGTDATSEWGHQLDGYGVDVIEWEASGPKENIDLGTWKNVGVSKIVNLS